MGDNLDPGGVDVLVRLNEMGSNNCAEKLGRGDRMFLGHDVDGLLHGVCRYDNAIVCFCVTIPFQLGVMRSIARYIRGLDISFEEHAYCHFYHGLDPSLCILMDFVDSDVVFAILGCGNLRHDSFWRVIRELRMILRFG